METQANTKRWASPIGGDLRGRIEMTMKTGEQTGRGFALLVLSIENLASLARRRPADAQAVLRELYHAVRGAVHPSQFVAAHKNGIAVIFEGMGAGHADDAGRRLMLLGDKVVKAAQQKLRTSPLEELLNMILAPQRIAFRCEIGWAIYPRDGGSAAEIMKRAEAHLAERSR